LIHKSASLLVAKDRPHAINILERLIQGGSQTHRSVGDKAGDAVVAGAVDVIERLHEEFKPRIKTQTTLSSADTTAMLFWALLASGQINMRKVDGWQTLAISQLISRVTLQPETIPSCYRRSRHAELQPHHGRHRPLWPPLKNEWSVLKSRVTLYLNWFIRS
jgi:hypothetical protein